MKKILFFLWLPLVLQGCDGSLDSNQEELDQFVLDSSIWTVQLGTGTTDSAQGLSIDSQGNLYLAGYTSGDLQGNGNAGEEDLILVKYNSNGDRQWTRQLGSSGDDVAFASATDSKGNVYAAGYTEGGFDGNTHPGNYDIFLVKYDTNGNKQWHKEYGTSDNETIFDITTNASDDVYVAGYTGGTFPNNTSEGNDDIIVIKYDSDGDMKWTKQYGSSGSDYARGISLDSSNNIYVTGDTSDSFDNSRDCDNRSVDNYGSEDLFLIKFLDNSSVVWTKQMGTFSNDVAFEVATDSLGNSYVTGYTGSSLDSNTHFGELDLFLIKFNKDGECKWSKQLGTSSSDYARGVSVDADGNVSFTGYTNAALDGQTHYGSDDLFLVKYNSSGTKKLWTRQLGTTTLDRAVDVIHDASGNAFIAGSTLGDLDYQRSKGGDDLFLVKYNSDGVKQ
jgi:hypothetical protein